MMVVALPLLIAVKITDCPATGMQIEKCKLSMRESLKACEEAGGDAVIPAELYDPNGELDEEHIFCAKCRIGHCFEARPPPRACWHAGWP